MSFTLGCDPELVPFKGNRAIPAWELTSGTKQRPLAVATDPDIGLKELWDGLALEFNIDPVTIGGNLDIFKFSSNIAAAMYALTAKHGLDVLSGEPVIRNDWYGAKHEKMFGHPNAMTIGCDPDFCAYDTTVMMPRPTPFTPTPTNVRYTGGHIHVGYDKKMAPPHIFAKMMDLFVGLGSRDIQKDRRAVYGCAGLYRPKPYGMEYRTPSAYWTTSQSETWRVATNVSALIHGLENYPDKMRELYQVTPWKNVRMAINSEGKLLSSEYFGWFARWSAQNMPEVAERLYHNCSDTLEREFDELAQTARRANRGNPVFTMATAEEPEEIFDDYEQEDPT